MRFFSCKSTVALALFTSALVMVAAPAFARGGGGGGGHGGGGGGGHASGGGGGHVSGGGGAHYGGGAAHYSGHYGSAGGGRAGFAGPTGTYRGPIYGSAYGHGGYGAYGGAYHGYVGGGRGVYAAGGRVPAFYGHGYYGGPRGRVWWGPGYGWRVPGYWGGYYTPYAAYWGTPYWVTDWVMLDYLAAEEARMSEYRGSSMVAVPVQTAPLPTGVREELRTQIAEALATPAPIGGGDVAGPGNTLVVNDPRVANALAAPHHVFVVSSAVTVSSRSNGGTCALTQADLVRSSSPIPSGQATADVTVAAAKNGSCEVGTIVAMPVADLVHFEETLLERVARGAAAANAANAESVAPPTAPPVAPSSPNTLRDSTPREFDVSADDDETMPHDLSTPTPPALSGSGGMSL